MNIVLGWDFHPETFFVTPALVIQQGECECCAEPGGIRLGVSLFCLSGWIAFSNGGHCE